VRRRDWRNDHTQEVPNRVSFVGDSWRCHDQASRIYQNKNNVIHVENNFALSRYANGEGAAPAGCPLRNALAPVDPGAAVDVKCVV